VHCSTPPADYNVCVIFDAEYHTPGPGSYVLRSTNRAATAEELRYTYLTGKAIGLEGGLELTRMDEMT